MKKIGFIISVLFCFSVFISEVTAASLESVFVTSDVSAYRQLDFPGVSGGSRILIGSKTYVSTEQVTVDSTPTGNGASLSIPLPGWDMWLGVFSSPAIGDDWAAQYSFHTNSASTTLNLESCTFQELDIPQNVIIRGSTISWDPVVNATYYKLRWFQWNNGARPDLESGPQAETDYLAQPSYTMTSLAPGTYALRVEAYEFCGDNPVNRSNYYVKHVCGPSIFIIASVHETTFGNSEKYRIVSYFLPDSMACFNKAKHIATIDWNGNLYTYVWYPQFKMVNELYDRFMLAILYPTQATPIELDLLENVTYKFTIEDCISISNCEFSIPENSFSWLDIPYATYDQATRTVSWTKLGESDVHYSVRIYPPLLDGSPNIREPLFNKHVNEGETHCVLPNAAPALPGYFVAVQAFQTTTPHSANFSRDYIKLPVVYTFDGKVVIQGD